MGQIKFILALLVILSICSCTRNKSDIQPSVSAYENPLDVQNNITEINDNITNSYLSIFFSETNTNSRIKINNLDLSYFSSFFSEESSIKSIDIMGRAFSDLSPLTLLPNLEELTISLNNHIHDITPLASLVNLKKLTLMICYNIESIEPLSSLINLKYLRLDYDDTYYEELAALQNLEFLDLSTSYPGMEEIDVVHIVKLPLLKELSIQVKLRHSSSFGRIRNINLLENLANLEVLSFRYVAPDISWITGLKKLKKFEINDGYIEDLRPLLELPGLVEVDLSFTEVKDISVLLESKTIKKVTGPRLWDNELLARFSKKGIEYEESYSDR
jgi:hypothetical protein